MISVANVAGGFDPYSFAAYFTVVFVWIGVSRPRWTSLLVLPLVAATCLGAAGVGDEAQAAGVFARVSRELLGCATATVLLPDSGVADLLHRRGQTEDGLPVAAPGVWVSSRLRPRLTHPGSGT
jgi:hypothetical protein